MQPYFGFFSTLSKHSRLTPLMISILFNNSTYTESLPLVIVLYAESPSFMKPASKLENARWRKVCGISPTMGNASNVTNLDRYRLVKIMANMYQKAIKDRNECERGIYTPSCSSNGANTSITWENK